MGFGSNIMTALFSGQCGNMERETDIANTLMARDYKGFGNQRMNGVICANRNDDK